MTEERSYGHPQDVAYDWYKSRVWFTTGSGDDEETHYPVGQTMDTFAAANGPGLLLLHGPAIPSSVTWRRTSRFWSSRAG